MILLNEKSAKTIFHRGRSKLGDWNIRTMDWIEKWEQIHDCFSVSVLEYFKNFQDQEKELKIKIFDLETADNVKNYKILVLTEFRNLRSSIFLRRETIILEETQTVARRIRGFFW